jgi:mRNA interferase MazF
VAGLPFAPGDIVEVDLGSAAGREAGFRHPAIVVTPQRILDQRPNVVHVVPLTTTLRPFGSEVTIEPDEGNGLPHPSAAQCQHIRAVSISRVDQIAGNVGPTVRIQIRNVLGLILDIPA